MKLFILINIYCYHFLIHLFVYYLFIFLFFLNYLFVICIYVFLYIYIYLFVCLVGFTWLFNLWSVLCFIYSLFIVILSLQTYWRASRCVQIEMAAAAASCDVKLVGEGPGGDKNCEECNKAATVFCPSCTAHYCNECDGLNHRKALQKHARVLVAQAPALLLCKSPTQESQEERSQRSCSCQTSKGSEK